MRQIVRMNGRMSGFGAAEFCDCHALALEAWGEAANEPDSGLVAMAYLWRRFGHPLWGSDPHKEACRWILTTKHPEIWLDVSISGSPLCYGARCYLAQGMNSGVYAGHGEWMQAAQAWFEASPHYTGDSLWNCDTRQAFWPEMIAAIGESPRMAFANPDWRSYPEKARTINETLFAAMKQLLRPVFVRDVPICILGTSGYRGRTVERSRYAGLGTPKKPLDELLALDPA